MTVLFVPVVYHDIMAIDPEKFRNLRENLDDIVELAPGDSDAENLIMDTVLGEALRETEELVEESRPPRMYVFGRSGAGKSSLINALANRQAADVGAVKPETVESELYHIEFPDRYSSWDIVDSRGLFESATPDGDLPEDTKEFMKQDLKEYKPDVLLHVITPDQARAGEDDFDAVRDMREELDQPFPPILYVVNKVDQLGNLGEWPPEEHESLAGDIKEVLDFVAQVTERVDETEMDPFSDNRPLHGYKFDCEEYVGIVPVHLQTKENYWNVETLSQLIGDFLPTDARLQFMQAQQRQELMRDMSRDLTKRFSVIGTGIGAAPTSAADIAPLTAMQLLLVGLVGGFSCEEIEKDTVEDYVTSMGGTTAAAFGFRGLARGIVQFVPGLGSAISGAVAGGGTYAVGHSAEKYFFDDTVKKPSVFVGEGKEYIKNMID
jgi:predicted GTPase